MLLTPTRKVTPASLLTRTTIKQEISLYSIISKMNSDLSLFWLEYSRELPLLSTLVKQYLAIPAASVASESTFSQANNFTRKNRLSLTSTTTRMSMFLKDKKQARKLFNENVVAAQPVSRDMGESSSGSGLPVGSHSGTKVTTESGNEYLIHHGSGFAAPGSNPTVITDASNMSSNWNSVGEAYKPDSSVGGMMGKGEGYNVFSHNCNDVTASMPNSSVDATTTFGVSTGIEPKK
ncbi:unnamed protein product [Didymodactylos carnosus]|uniref:HAT C-terminal dimerisation domain-containing protein n=1 Tax=Didymodactylos carnosus TaxID=1234261 RepID=A0A815SCX3_9BILA|nr:unnamed protein product [Didymodactylos carnosus]CAF4354129.1 unnamed protein product [Didymodactylos carnosus]